MTIGVDPHKGSHTAVAIGRDEHELDGLRLQSSAKQCDVLLDWADRFPQRRSAIVASNSIAAALRPR